MSIYSEALLTPIDDNFGSWSDHFFINPSPKKKPGLKTIPSSTTAQIGRLLCAIGAFYGLTAEAVWYVDYLQLMLNIPLQL